MRRLVYGMLAVMLGLGSVGAKVHTNKTFLMPRSHVDNMAVECTTWHKQYRKMLGDGWGASLQLTGFYEASRNETDLGKYFGKYNPATGPGLTNPYAGKVQDFIWVMDRPVLVASNPAATPNPVNNEMAFLLDPDKVFHDASASVLDINQIDVKGYMRPERTSYGLRLDYHQKLDKLTNGLYFKASAPLVHVKHDMHMCYTGGFKTGKLKQLLPGSTTTYVTLADYLGGKVRNTSPTNLQDCLCKAKICGSQSKTGIADIEAVLGYNFLYKEHKHCGAFVSLTIPTNGEPDGEWLFEPVLGHAGHWAFGLGLDSAFEIWEQGNRSLEFVGRVHYKYVLEATEVRTVGFKYPRGEGVGDAYLVAGKHVPMGHYMLGAQKGVAKVFPLANILTRPVGVHPGSQIEVLADLAFNWGNFTFDCGYNLFAKAAECVSVKCWVDDTYVRPADDYSTALVFNDEYFDVGIGADIPWIQHDDLLPCVAATPVYVTHKIFATFGYAWNKWKWPLMLGMGASWEWAQGSNSALDGYAVWMKAGVSF